MAPRIGPALAHSGRALVCDDVSELVDIYQRLVAHQFPQMTIERARNGTDAWEILQAGRFDLVITDFHCHGMNGIELCMRARLRYPDTALALVSAYNDLPLGVSGLGVVGVDAFIQKPFEVVPFTRMLRYLVVTPPQMRKRLRENGAQHLPGPAVDESLAKARKSVPTKWCVEGHQNAITSRFCGECGRQLPSAEDLERYDPLRGDATLTRKYYEGLTDPALRALFEKGMRHMEKVHRRHRGLGPGSGAPSPEGGSP